MKSECMNEGSGSGGGVLMNATNARYCEQSSVLLVYISV